MNKQLAYIIIGNGITGVTAAELLRTTDPSCSLTIIADEMSPVYYRPALKDFLAGRIPEDKLWARPSSFYQQQRIQCVSEHVVGINPQQQFVQTHTGRQLHYDKLLLANGARPRQLTCPGSQLTGVMTLRTMMDYQFIRQHLSTTRNVVIIGGGTLALETAEALHHQGFQVTHLLRNNAIWSEILDATASDLVLQEERRSGITVHTEESIAEVVGHNGRVREIITTHGSHIPCDLVLVAIGIEPITDFARACGIACRQGIQVDASMRTSVPNIYAAGDVIETADIFTGRTRVIGQWYPAQQQAKIAAYSMLGIPPTPSSTQTFYNASFLCGLDFVSLGVTFAPPQAAIQELIAPPQPRIYRKILLRQGIPVGALYLGDRTQALAMKRAIDYGVNLSPIRNHLFDENFQLDDWLDYQRVPTILSTDHLHPTPLEPARAGVRAVTGLEHRTDTKSLSTERVNFEIDMCIGCDRCMQVCPVPLSSQVGIADLNQATHSAETLPHITNFTHACVLCGSCVPVCPVDNHRDLLMLSLKQRLGDPWQSNVDMSRLQQKLPQGITIPSLLHYLRMQRLLSDPNQIPDIYLLHLILASQILTLPPDTTVVQEGAYGRDLFLLLHGHLELSATDSSEQSFPIAVLGPGEFVGEYGILSGRPHPATARTATATLLLKVPEQALRRLIELVPAVETFFAHMNDAYTLTSIMKRMALFQDIADDAMQFLVSQTQIKQYDRNALLFTEEGTGRPQPETFHILLEGFVKVVRRHSTALSPQPGARVIAYRQHGDYFLGGMDLLGDKQAVTVSAINRTRVAEISYASMQQLFQHYPDIEARFTQRLQAYQESINLTATAAIPAIVPGRAVSSSSTRRNIALHSLVNDGVVEGTEVLVIDLNACIHCNECEEACERRHGHSRLNRKGMVINNIDVVTTCRQCQDPVCMLCSRAGIARTPDGEVYITDSCIGCGICAERCPYHAISIVDVATGQETHEEEPSSWKRFNDFLHNGITIKPKKQTPLPVLNGLTPSAIRGQVAPGPLDGSRSATAYDEMRKKVAVKCDLCAGYADQACVQACPTGAAFRVQPTAFFGSTEHILQRSRS